MRLNCPCCGEQFPMEAGFQDDDGKRLAALFAGLEPKLGRAVLSYLRLFSPAKRSLRTSRAIRLVEELVALVESGVVSKDARTTDSRRCPPAVWVAGIEQMLQAKERLQLPLENHNYLRAVVFGLAGDQGFIQQQAAAPVSRGGKVASPRELLQEAYSRIDSDLVLGLISREQADAQKAALRVGGNDVSDGR
jgi:hypothetical protein